MNYQRIDLDIEVINDEILQGFESLEPFNKIFHALVCDLVTAFTSQKSNLTKINYSKRSR